MLQIVNNNIQNIMTVEFNTTSKDAKTASFDSYRFEIEGEGVKTGNSLESFRDFIEACTYIMHNVKPFDPWSIPQMMGQKTIIAHIYTHELSYVFHWMRNVFSKELSVFTNTWMNPITADLTINNVIFRFHDTSRLVPKSLEEWAHDENLSGNIVLEGMKCYRSKYGSLEKIPVSQAGELRRECRRKITNKAWLQQTEETIRSYDLSTYQDLIRCFMGGTLGVSPIYKNLLLHDVMSDDLASAYPGVMATRKFPVSPWEDSEYKTNDNDYFYYLTVNVKRPYAKGINKFYPFAKCDNSVNPEEEGFALSYADEVTLTLTDIDFEIFKRTYNYESIDIIKCRRSKAAYLPKQLVKIILKNYADKTELKGTDEVSKYREAKIKNNCMYGISVTKTITDEISFEDGVWVKKEIRTEEDFNKARDNSLKAKQFLSYQIGVWVTAYVREIMWNIIPKIDADVVYFDTDCIKHNNPTTAFKEENDRLLNLIKAAAEHHHISVTKFCPKNKPIGLFETEALSYDFKALDVKRYAKRTDDGVEAFISGMPKDHINLEYVKDLSDTMEWSPESSGRYQITYNDTDGFSVTKIPAPFRMRPYYDSELLQMIIGLNIRCNKTKMFRSL